MARPADVARDADSPLVNRSLEPTQAGVVAGEGRPVIGQEDDDRRAGDSSGLDRLEQAADVGVDVRHHRINTRNLVFIERAGQGAAAGREFLATKLHASIRFQFRFRGLERIVRAIEREVEEEGTIRRSLHEIDRRGGENVTAIAGIAPGLAVVKQDRVEVMAARPAGLTAGRCRLP